MDPRLKNSFLCELGVLSGKNNICVRDTKLAAKTTLICETCPAILSVVAFQPRQSLVSTGAKMEALCDGGSASKILRA